MSKFNIWLDGEGKETKREVKGRGRPLRGFVKGQDGNWYSDLNKMPVPVADPSSSSSSTPVSSSISSSGHVFLIWLDKDGNEEKREPKGRGRGPRDFQKREDGNWYYTPPWKSRIEAEAKKTDVGAEAEAGTEEVKEFRPKLRRIRALSKTTPERIARALHVMSHDQRGGTITFIGPIRIGETGLDELDAIPGQPVFHKIEVDERSKTVAIWSITSPGGPSLIFEDALEDNI